MYPPSSLLHCLIGKVEQHSNTNITKYCIQSLLTTKEGKILFEEVESMVYGSLVQTLNVGVHYHDCILFHHDSKLYAMIR